jgi:hypothetical protein
MSATIRSSRRVQGIIASIILITMLAMPATVGATPRPAAYCQNVAGTVVAQIAFTEVGFDAYTIEATGPMAGTPPGTKFVTAVIQSITPGGTIHFTSIHEWPVTDFGPMKSSDVGHINPNGRGHMLLTIVEGGSGFIQVHSLTDLNTGIVDVRYHGRVCPN